MVMVMEASFYKKRIEDNLKSLVNQYDEKIIDLQEKLDAYLSSSDLDKAESLIKYPSCPLGLNYSDMYLSKHFRNPEQAYSKAEEWYLSCQEVLSKNKEIIARNKKRFAAGVRVMESLGCLKVERYYKTTRSSKMTERESAWYTDLKEEIPTNDSYDLERRYSDIKKNIDKWKQDLETKQRESEEKKLAEKKRKKSRYVLSRFSG